LVNIEKYSYPDLKITAPQSKMLYIFYLRNAVVIKTIHKSYCYRSSSYRIYRFFRLV